MKRVINRNVISIPHLWKELSTEMWSVFLISVLSYFCGLSIKVEIVIIIFCYYQLTLLTRVLTCHYERMWRGIYDIRTLSDLSLRSKWHGVVIKISNLLKLATRESVNQEPRITLWWNGYALGRHFSPGRLFLLEHLYVWRMQGYPVRTGRFATDNLFHLRALRLLWKRDIGL